MFSFFFTLSYYFCFCFFCYFFLFILYINKLVQIAYFPFNYCSLLFFLKYFIICYLINVSTFALFISSCFIPSDTLLKSSFNFLSTSCLFSLCSLFFILSVIPYSQSNYFPFLILLVLYPP